MSERTIPSMFEESVRKFPHNVMMWEKRGDRYEGATYGEIHTLVEQFAAGLMHRGIRKGDRLALISEGRYYWVVAELGILYSGAINVPVSVKIQELSDLKFRLAHAGCRMAVVSRSQAEKIDQIKSDLPELERVILLDARESADRDEIFIRDLLREGRDFLTHRRAEFEERLRGVREDDPANICYTSGTTADPKGILLTHRNYTANVAQASSLLPIPSSYTTLLILPWDHAFAHTAGIYTLMANGASMASVQTGRTALETLKNIPQNIREIRPVFLLSVPALAKNFRQNIEKGIQSKGSAVQRLFRRALTLAYGYYGEGWNRGRGLRRLRKPLVMLYDRLIFRRIREQFGGRLRFFIGGGALLDIELQRFFYAIGMPMYQGYGLTEAAPIISANVPEKHKLGSSGFVVQDLEVRIRDDEGNDLPRGERGEIVVKGENVMAGYWRNAPATEEILRDGWLHTGDMGYLDGDGFLYVLGRFKSLLIANDGEKYSPEGIEEALTEHSPIIEQVMLYNNQNPYTVALLVPVRDALLRRIKALGQSPQTEAGQDTALSLLEGEIRKYRKGGPFAGMFPERWLPSAVAVLGEPFSEQNQFLNSTLKMVRGKIADFYRNRIDHMYTPEGKNILNSQNRTIIRRLEH